MTKSGFLAGLATSLFLGIGDMGAPAIRAAAPPPPPPPAEAAPTDPFAADLLRRLGSANATERQAAQNQLSAIAKLFDQTDAMQQLSEMTADAELKSLFQERVNQIKAKEEEKRLSNLPPLSLSLKSATLTDVVDAINKSLNSTAKLTAVNSGRPVTFDLDVKDKPFWQVIAMLQDQQPLELMSGGTNSIRLNPASASIRRYAIDGPAMAWVTSVNFSRSLNYRSTDTAAQSQMPISIMVAIDPRIRATQFKIVKITSAVDNEGRTYRSNTSGGYSSSGTSFFNQQIMVLPPERLGRTLSVSFDGAATTTVGDPVITIDDIQKNIGKQVTMGNRTIRLTNFNSTSSTIGQVQLSATPLSEAMAGDSISSRITYSILDATGRAITSGSLSTGTSGSSIPLQSTTPPYKLELRSTGRPVDIHVHLDLKDLPLP